MDYTFPGQKEGEKVISLIRKHPAVLSLPLVKALVFLIPSTFILIKFRNPYLVILSFIIFVFALSYCLYRWAVWYGEMYIISTERVIGIFQKGIFNREVAEISLEKVNDVTFEIKGIFSTVFGLGKVSIHAGNNILEIEDISDPRGMQTKINDLVEKKTQATKRKVTEELANLIKGK